MKKKLCATKVSPLGDRKMAFTISTAAVDRDGDTIDPKGWDLSNYKRSPVVLWAHDHSQLPIARATHVWHDGRGLHAEVEFPPRGLYQFADVVHDMVKAGFLSSTSVGFLPKSSRPNRTGGQGIMQAELLEFSIVAVPANPGALVLQRGANHAAMRKWLGHEQGLVDWGAINGEIDVTNDDVRRVVHAFTPVIAAGVAGGLRLMAREAAQCAVNRLTG
jgi:HK97 family phage prohead protease